MKPAPRYISTRRRSRTSGRPRSSLVVVAARRPTAGHMRDQGVFALRCIARRLPADANRQVNKRPSADTRARWQSPQNGVLTERRNRLRPRHHRTRSARPLLPGTRPAIDAAASARRAWLAQHDDGTIRSSRQSLLSPTSMNSMKRTTCPVPRKRSSSGTTALVDAALHDGIDLQPLEAGRHRGVDAGLHLADLTAPSGHLGEHLRIQRPVDGGACAAGRRRAGPAPAGRAARRWWSARCPPNPG